MYSVNPWDLGRDGSSQNMDFNWTLDVLGGQGHSKHPRSYAGALRPSQYAMSYRVCDEDAAVTRHTRLDSGFPGRIRALTILVAHHDRVIWYTEAQSAST